MVIANKQADFVRVGIWNYLAFGLVGLLTSFILAWIAIRVLLGATLSELQPVTGPLAFSGIISLLIGFVATWFTSRFSRSLLFTLISAYLWSSILILTNFWNGARLMFFNNDHDLPFAISLIVFASKIGRASCRERV